MFANMLFLVPIVLALLGVGVLIWTRREEIFSKSCSSCRGWGYWYNHAILGPSTKETCTTCNGAGRIRRLDMFKSWVAYVVHALKHCMLFGVCLLFFVLGLFAVYLGSTGSWDGMTIISALIGLAGFLVLLRLYIMPFCEWLGRKEEELEAEMCEEEALDAVSLKEEKPEALLEKRIAHL